LQARLILEATPHAPVHMGETVGTLALELDREPYAEFPLVALKEIRKGNLFQRAIDKFQLWLK
jgi:D-alanyl-D-alanine carboxypeptidase (penicillin-binding protein 5/6)